MRIPVIVVVFISIAWQSQVQHSDDSLLTIKLKKGTLSLEGYVDVYYSYALSHPKDATHPYFVSYSGDNEINLDLAYFSLKYTSDRVRASFAPGYGTYMNSNYVAGRQTLQNILEASVGIKLFKDKDIWLDGGVFSAPYTNESVYSFDQLTYTRSLGADAYAGWQERMPCSGWRQGITDRLRIFTYCATRRHPIRICG
ncbi:MAG: outer membrane beta-barrel protein [Puia sp.]|nr:outer membrane beta-barrel protein [Puia sp.]